MCHTVKQSMLHSTYMGEHPQLLNWSALILEFETVYPRKTRKKIEKKKDLVILIKSGTYVK